MTELPPVRQRIILDASGVPAAVATTTAGLATIGNEATVATAKTAGFGRALKSVFGGLLFTTSILAVGAAVKNMRDEAVQTEVELQRLGLALANVGGVSEKDAKAIGDYAQSFQSLGFEGSEATNAMGTLVQATGSVEQAQKLMSISADYARNKHVSLASAAQLMARATTGNMRAFKLYGITLDDTLPKNEAIAKAFDELNKKIGGSAVKYLDTFAGRTEVMKQKFEDFVEVAVGGVLPFLTKFMGALIRGAEWIQQNSGALKVYLGLLLVVTTALKGVAIVQAIIAGINPFTWMIIGAVALGVVFVKLWNVSKIFRETMAEALATVVQLIGAVIGAFAKLARVIAKVTGNKWLAGVADEAEGVAKSVNKAAKSIDDLKNKKLTAPKAPTLPDFLKPGTSTGILGNSGKADAAGKDGSGTGTNVQYVTVYASNTNDIAKKMSRLAKQGTPIGGTSR